MSAHPFFIGDSIVVPGLYQKIAVPSREINWTITGAAAGGLGAATVWRGVKIPEGGIVIETLLVDDAGNPIRDVEDATGIWVPFIFSMYPNPAVKPPVFSCFHPLLIARLPPIANCSIAAHDLVSPRGDHLSWHGILTLQAIVPQRKAAAAPPDPAKLSQKSSGPIDEVERQIDELRKQAGL